MEDIAAIPAIATLIVAAAGYISTMLLKRSFDRQHARTNRVK